MGRPGPRPGRVPERRRHRGAHPRDQSGLLPVAGRGDPHRGDRGRDGGDRRGGGALLRPSLPVAPLHAGRREVRAHPAGEPGPAPPHGGRDPRGPAQDRRGVGEPLPGARFRTPTVRAATGGGAWARLDVDHFLSVHERNQLAARSPLPSAASGGRMRGRGVMNRHRSWALLTCCPRRRDDPQDRRKVKTASTLR
jgi:hypothetical protein